MEEDLLTPFMPKPDGSGCPRRETPPHPPAGVCKIHNSEMVRDVDYDDSTRPSTVKAPRPCPAHLSTRIRLYFPREAREAGGLPNKVEGADDSSEASANKTPLSLERAKEMTTMVGGKVSDNSPKDWFNKIPEFFREACRLPNMV